MWFSRYVLRNNKSGYKHCVVFKTTSQYQNYNNKKLNYNFKTRQIMIVWYVSLRPIDLYLDCLKNATAAISEIIWFYQLGYIYKPINRRRIQ